jgi:hypothetical protein
VAVFSYFLKEMTVISYYFLKVVIISVVLSGIVESYRFRLFRENAVVTTRSLLKLNWNFFDGDDTVASSNIEDADNSNQKNDMDTIVGISTSVSPIMTVDSVVTINYTDVNKATSPTATQSIAISVDASVTAEPSLTAATDSASIISPEDFHVVSRVDPKDEIRHLEMYLKRRKGGIIMISIMIMTVVGSDDYKYDDIH